MESTRQWSCSVMLQEKTQGTVFLGRDYVLDVEELLRDIMETGDYLHPRNIAISLFR